MISESLTEEEIAHLASLSVVDNFSSDDDVLLVQLFLTDGLKKCGWSGVLVTKSATRFYEAMPISGKSVHGSIHVLIHDQSSLQLPQ